MLRYCPLFSGSSGNCALVEAGDTRLLLDAGLSGSTITGALSKMGVEACSLKGILITHEHSDHIKGAGILSRKYDLPLYANAATWEAMSRSLGEIRPANMRVIETGRDFYVGPLNAYPFSISHDAADPVGYVLSYGGRKVSVLTDLGYISGEHYDVVEGSDLLMLESNHDVEMLKRGRYSYPLKQRILGRKGHLSNVDAGKALSDLFAKRIRRVILGHLSQENNIEKLALDTVSGVLAESGIRPGRDIQLFVAHRDRAQAFTIE